jgi:hypothetical protein
VSVNIDSESDPDSRTDSNKEERKSLLDNNNNGDKSSFNHDAMNL